MRLPLPRHIKLKHAFVFASCVLFAQLAESTDPTFAVLFFAYIVISTVAFNAAGGLVRPTGAFVFFNATLTAIVGLTYKLSLGEPGQSNLRAPNLTMGMYCVGMVTTAIVAGLALKIAPKEPLLPVGALGEQLKYAAIPSFVVGAIIQVATNNVIENGSILATLRQINVFTPMAIVLATFYQVRKSQGARSGNWIVWSAVSWAFFFGILSTSKERILIGPLCWLGAAIAAGHNFTRKQVLAVVIAGAFFQMYLVPYSQVARNFRPETPSFSGDVALAWKYLRDPQETRDSFAQAEHEMGVEGAGSRPHLYSMPQGFFDRLNMLAPDDALTAYTAQGEYEGLLPTIEAIFNIIPRFLWKDKPLVYTGNQYAREIGMISEVNEGTGVSFSPGADAYHQVGWYGVLFLLPAVLLLLFVVMESLGGDVRRSPWALLFGVLCAHQAPEGLIGGQIYVATYGAFAVAAVAFASRYVMSYIGKVLLNAERTRAHTSMDFKPVLRPRALASASPSSQSAANPTPPDLGA